MNSLLLWTVCLSHHYFEPEPCVYDLESFLTVYSSFFINHFVYIFNVMPIPTPLSTSPVTHPPPLFSTWYFILFALLFIFYHSQIFYISLLNFSTDLSPFQKRYWQRKRLVMPKQEVTEFIGNSVYSMKIRQTIKR